MLMPKSHTKEIYEYLFNEGVLVAKKDVHLAKHPLIQHVPNLHVMKALNSLKSRGLVKEQFAWRHFYWYLTNEGIEFIRDYLHLPSDVVPGTMKEKKRAVTNLAKPAGGRQDYREQGASDRTDYRKAAEKKADLGLGAGQQMEFRGGASSGYGGGYGGQSGQGFGGFGRGAPRS